MATRSCAVLPELEPEEGCHDFKGIERSYELRP